MSESEFHSSILEGNREITCCFTGHRETELTPRLVEKLIVVITEAYNNGYRYFCTGGALGFDTIAAQVLISSKLYRLPELKLILVLPYPRQSEHWSNNDINIYDNIIGKADEVIYTSPFYHNGCMFVRNRRLIDVSTLCFAYQNKNDGGTAYTVNYAKEQGIKIINLT